jgi:hypothetical protein
LDTSFRTRCRAFAYCWYDLKEFCERKHIEWLHGKRIFWLWWNLIFLGKKVLWITIIIAIEACVATD